VCVCVCVCVLQEEVVMLERGLGCGDVLGFADTMDELVPAVAHDGTSSEEDVAWSKPLDGEVTL
jgi:hypothetical protein